MAAADVAPFQQHQDGERDDAGQHDADKRGADSDPDGDEQPAKDMGHNL